MNVFAFLSLGSFFLILILGAFVFHRGPKTELNRVFGFGCLLLACYSFTEFMYRQSGSFEQAHFWLQLGCLKYYSVSFLIHFVLTFTEKRKLLQKKISYFFIYGPAFAFFFVAQLPGDLVNSVRPVKEYWGYTYETLTTWYDVFVTVWAMALSLASIPMSLAYYFKVKDEKKKNQAKYIAMAVSLPVTFGLLESVFPLFLHTRIPELVNISLVWLLIFITYAIVKNELFTLNPETAAQNILSTMPDSLMLVDSQLNVIDVNRAFESLLGYHREELIGTPAYRIFQAADEKVSRTFIENMGAEGAHAVETFYLPKKGDPIPISISLSVIRDKKNEIAGIVAVARDMREIKRLQSQLLQSEKLSAIGQLAAGLAHEINNPMGVILGFAQSVAKRIDENDPFAMPLKSIEREAIRCKKLIEDLLTFSRVGGSEKEPGDLNEAVEQALSLVKIRAKGSNAEIITEFQNDLPQITINANQIQQLVVNLCNNALDAMPDGGPLSITTKLATENAIELTVTDSGLGMTEEVKRHIFDPFFTTKEVGKGTGLGLSLCYEIVQRHGGTIDVQSLVGKGTEFKVRLAVE